MKLPKNLFLRKLFILPFLVVAGLLIGDVYQRFTSKTPEEVLMALGAQQVLTQSISVNGKQVLTDIWRLPDFASTASLRKLHAKIITVGREVYVFHDDFSQLRGHCTYPANLPPWSVDCHYVIDAAHSQFISASSTQPADQLLHAFTTSATAAGWQPLNEHVWQKDDLTLFVHVVDDPDHTQALLAIRKALP